MATHSHSCSCEGGADNSTTPSAPAWKKYFPGILSLVLLLIGLISDHFFAHSFFRGYVRTIWYILAYIPVGFPVLKEAFDMLKEKDFFNEFSLMSIATIGAFAIGEYPEAVAVMLFYAIGELFQDAAVSKAQNNIKALLDIRPDSATLLKDGKYVSVKPESVSIGDIIQVKAGEKVPLDGLLLSPQSSFNTSALTGESKPTTIRKGDTVLAGMLNIDKVVEVEVSKKYEDSSLAKILDLVQNATSRKAKTELMIRKFAKIYTPIVFFLALAITIIPYFFLTDYIFSDWLYRALVFLVISCPCALVISVPLGYFGGIGAASRNGILFKGANYLDLMAKVNTVVMDKTGTLTKGVFEVQDVVTTSTLSQEKFIGICAAIESYSNHPIAKAITKYGEGFIGDIKVDQVEEVSGYGLEGKFDNIEVRIGNAKMMQKCNIDYDKAIESIVETTVIVAIDKQYAGYITIADQIKEDAPFAITEMYKQGIENTVILSGDKKTIVEKVSKILGVKNAFGELLPEDKVEYIENLKKDPHNVVAFVGDGINDAPSLALSDVGIAMGGIGSDAAIETADMIIQTDEPSKIALGIKIAKGTRQIIFQNIILAFTVKIVVLTLGALGIATMWEAVFADVGVALLAILNSVRILNKKF